MRCESVSFSSLSKRPLSRNDPLSLNYLSLCVYVCVCLEMTSLLSKQPVSTFNCCVIFNSVDGDTLQYRFQRRIVRKRRTESNSLTLFGYPYDPLTVVSSLLVCFHPLFPFSSLILPVMPLIRVRLSFVVCLQSSCLYSLSIPCGSIVLSIFSSFNHALSPCVCLCLSQITTEGMAPFQTFLHWDVATLAEQLTLSDFKAFKRIKVCFSLPFMVSCKNAKSYQTCLCFLFLFSLFLDSLTSLLLFSSVLLVFFLFVALLFRYVLSLLCSLMCCYSSIPYPPPTPGQRVAPLGMEQTRTALQSRECAAYDSPYKCCWSHHHIHYCVFTVV